MYEIYLIFLIFTTNIISIKAEYFCNANEIHFKTWCYKLYELETITNYSNCKNLLSNDSNSFISCLNSVLTNIFKIYTNNPKLDDLYEFTSLKSPFKDDKSLNIWLQLIEQFYLIKNKTISHLNIFFNSYSFNNHAYVENQPFNIENPNLLKHSDDEHNNSNEKCLFVHQTLNFNEKFNFKFGNCDKKLAFICIKPPLKSNNTNLYDLNQRCSKYTETSPGGNWFNCDQLFNIIDNNEKFKMSRSQKCCMYNTNWKEDFFNANKICSNFESDVFTFKSKGYTSMLGTYDSYLNKNYDKSNQTEFINFWTSCKQIETMVKNEPICSQDADSEKIDNYEFDYPLSSGFLIYSLKYSFRNQTEFKLNKFNLSKAYKVLNHNYENISNELINLCPEFIQINYLNCLIDFFDSLIKDSYLISRRKETHSSNLIKQVFRIKTKTFYNQCFKFKIKNNHSIDLSLPFLDKCYHFSLFNRTILNDYESLIFDEPIESINSNYLHGILKSIGIIEIECSIGQKNRLFLIKNIENSTKLSNCSKYSNLIKLNVKKINKFNEPDFDWLKYLNLYLSNLKFILFLHSYSQIEKILTLNCYDSVQKLSNLIEKCNKFYNYDHCLFKCPSNCDYNSIDQQQTIWQVDKFKYLITSSICKSAYHSNIFSNNQSIGLLYLSSFNNSNNGDKIYLHNNRISSNLWPPSGLVNKKNISKYMNFFFHFQNWSIAVNKPILKAQNILILVKAINFVSKNKLNMINIDIFSNYKLDSIKLNRLIHFSDDFYGLNFTEKSINTNNIYQTSINMTLTYKKLWLINNYFELYKYEIKFPINLHNIEYGYYLLDHQQTIHLAENIDQTSLKFQLIKNVSYSKKLNCNWYINDLSTEIPCSMNLNFRQDSNLRSKLNDLNNENLYVYPRTDIKDSNFLKKFTRILFSNTDIDTNRCKYGGYLTNEDICLCHPGFGGDKCEFVCDKGHFGRNCEFTCSDLDCTGYLICNKDPIGCSCSSGFYGYYCNQKCPVNFWGPGCLLKCDHCPNNECDRFKGNCLCNENSFGKYCENCINGFYGLNCMKKCPINCLKCDNINGSCLLENFHTTNQMSMVTFDLNDSINEYECSFDFYRIKCLNKDLQIEKYISKLKSLNITCYLWPNFTSSVCYFKTDQLNMNETCLGDYEITKINKSMLFCDYFWDLFINLEIKNLTQVEINDERKIFLNLDFNFLDEHKSNIRVERVYFLITNKNTSLINLVNNFLFAKIICKFDKTLNISLFELNFVNDNCDQNSLIKSLKTNHFLIENFYFLWIILDVRVLNSNRSFFIGTESISLNLSNKSCDLNYCQNLNKTEIIKKISNSVIKPINLILIILSTLILIKIIDSILKFILNKDELLDDKFLFELEFNSFYPMM